MSKTILIKNGTIVDGTGQSRYKSDVFIEGNYIVGINDYDKKDAEVIIDAEGLIVAPGFIDVHDHLDFIFPSPRHPQILRGWIHQGVTTIISGVCGISPAPINSQMKEELDASWRNLLPRDGLEFEWETISEYYDFLEKQGQAYNVAILTGHNTLRTNVMGFKARFAEYYEIEEMKRMLRESIKAGSIGLSLGLAYIPSVFSNTEELIELGSVLSEFDPAPPMVTHVRGMFTKFYHEAVKEVITVAEINNIPLQISHHAGGGLSRTRKLAIKEINQAIERGIKIGHDNLPFPARRTTIFKIFPPWLFDGGFDNFYVKLEDPEIRKQVVDEILNYVPKWPPWDHQYWLEKDFNLQILLNGFRKDEHLKFNNKSLGDIAEILAKEPIDALIDLVLGEKGSLFFLSGRGDDPIAEEYMIKILSDPNSSIGLDIVGIDLNSPCPGAYGGFTKILGNYVRERNVFSLEEAIRKMTFLPATQMQLSHRGLIKEGYFADITIFDEKNVKANATFENPNLLSEGIEHVLINGNIILDKGKHDLTILAGNILKRA